MLSLCLGLCVVLVGSDGPILNEVLYDPAGTDSGFEFVELLNVSDASFDLGRLSLVFINGADPTSPKQVWRGQTGQRLEPGQRYVIGEEFVLPRDEIARLALQNGPDALWLQLDDLTIDALAWGGVDALGEGEAARDAASASLARVPDGRDSDDNATDFQVAPSPTPGRANSRAQRVLPQTISLTPPWLAQAGWVRARGLLLAVGDDLQQRVDVAWWLDGTRVSTAEHSVDRGDSLRVDAELYLSAGRHALWLSASSEAAPVDSVLIAIQTGPGKIRLNEVMPAPREGEPEWIELFLVPPSDCDLAEYSIADEAGSPRRLDVPPLCPGGLVLLSSDCGSLRANYDLGAEIPCFETAGAWPNLNNSSSSEDTPADVVHLFDSGGALVDRFAYGGVLGLEKGRSYERGLTRGDVAGPWFLSPAPPTPGAANAVVAARLPAAGLALSPNPFSPDGDGVDELLHILLREPAGASASPGEIRDLRGELVRDLGEARGGGDLRQWIWDGRDGRGRRVPQGAYVVVVRTRDAAGVERSWRQLVALGGNS